MMEFNTALAWYPQLVDIFKSDMYAQLQQFVAMEYQQHTIYPPAAQIFSAFNYTDYDAVKVCILGQDPYHGPHQANGLAFSVNHDVKIPPSLRNIYKEMATDLGVPAPNSGDLSHWAKQGVLLLNTVLTVRAGEAFSHRNHGWEQLTDYVIQRLNERQDPVVFILWGNPSIAKRQFIDESKHVVLTSPHPSPLSANRGFFGSRPFSKTNALLLEQGKTPIIWQ